MIITIDNMKRMWATHYMLILSCQNICGRVCFCVCMCASVGVVSRRRSHGSSVTQSVLSSYVDRRLSFSHPRRVQMEANFGHRYLCWKRRPEVTAESDPLLVPSTPAGIPSFTEEVGAKKPLHQKILMIRWLVLRHSSLPPVGVNLKKKKNRQLKHQQQPSLSIMASAWSSVAFHLAQ